MLHGSKRATAGIVAQYDEEGEALEHGGEVLGLLGSKGEEVGRVRITEVVGLRIEDVPWEFADAEGEGFTSLGDWLDGHRRHWERAGRVITPDTQLLCLSFDLLRD